jgi:hypothetical protein
MEPAVEILDLQDRQEKDNSRLKEMELKRAESLKKSDQQVFEDRLFSKDVMKKVAEELQPSITSTLESTISQ